MFEFFYLTTKLLVNEDIKSLDIEFIDEQIHSVDPEKIIYFFENF